MLYVICKINRVTQPTVCSWIPKYLHVNVNNHNKVTPQ